MKKLFLVFFGFAGMLILPLVAFAFSDVNSSHRFAEEINSLQYQGFVGGYSDGTYRPEVTINRAEFTKIVVASYMNQSEIDACDTEKYSFSDVPKNEWFAKYVCMAKKEGVINGYQDGTFRPNSNITLPEALKIILKVYHVNVPYTGPYYALPPDGGKQPVWPWYMDYIAYFINTFRSDLDKFPNLVDLRGSTKESILPFQIEDKASVYKVSRGEMAFFIIRTKVQSMTGGVCSSVPVCAQIQVQCIKAPCDPVWQDFSDSCEAEKMNPIQIIDGICPSGTLKGGDKDIHGCIGSAGYSWCEEKQKCLRVWEETCNGSTPSPSAQIIIIPSYEGVPTSCTSWFDGCNTCEAKNGKVGGCTQKVCYNETGKPNAYCIK